jgi:hypothetical protein
MGLPLDYPRINQFMEWFAIDKDKQYRVTRVNENSTQTYEGDDLLDGLKLNLSKEEWSYLKVEAMTD